MKIKILLITAVSVIFFLSSCDKSITSKAEVETGLDTVSYYVGIDVAKSLKASYLEDINIDAFVEGLKRELKEEEHQIEVVNSQIILQKFMSERQRLRIQKNLEDGRAFLEENKNKDGVIVTESGLQYEILEEGTGRSPSLKDTVVCHYEGTLLDGTVFDSSYEKDEPARFGLTRVIKAWQEGLPLMKEGAKYRFYVPTELGYGMRVRRGGKIEPNMALIFEIELIEVIPSDK